VHSTSPKSIIINLYLQVLTFQEKCLIQFGDDTERWAHFRDLRKIKIQEETDISCILCKSIQSTSSNKILLCHYCRRGYHQICHEVLFLVISV
jgi:polycomb-like protein 2